MDFSELGSPYPVYVPNSRPSYGVQRDSQFHYLYIGANSLIFVKTYHMFTVSIVLLICWNSISAQADEYIVLKLIIHNIIACFRGGSTAVFCEENGMCICISVLSFFPGVCSSIGCILM